jgi:hypothetical protein
MWKTFAGIMVSLVIMGLLVFFEVGGELGQLVFTLLGAIVVLVWSFWAKKS